MLIIEPSARAPRSSQGRWGAGGPRGRAGSPAGPWLPGVTARSCWPQEGHHRCPSPRGGTWGCPLCAGLSWSPGIPGDALAHPRASTRWLWDQELHPPRMLPSPAPTRAPRWGLWCSLPCQARGALLRAASRSPGKGLGSTGLGNCGTLGFVGFSLLQQKITTTHRPKATRT